MTSRSVGCAAAIAAGAWLMTTPLMAEGPGPMGQPAAAKESGADLYVAFCESCHGRKGLGDGPIASSLKTRPTDLTKLAKNNGGKYPHERVAMVLQFGVVVPAHGSTDMPSWGSTFRAMGDESLVQRRVVALSQHIESMQVK
jgi:mono/diheme cytochrome c family protein